MIRLITLFSFTALYSTAISQNIWIQRDSVKGPGRANAASFVLEDDGYFLTGYDGSNKKRSAVSYDIDQDDWDDEPSLGGITGDGLNRSSAIGFTSGLYGYVGLGEGEGFMFKDLWKFDRYNNVWTQMADYGGEARTQAVVFEIGDTAYVGTGKASDLSTLYNDFWKYDPGNNAWTEIASFPGTPRVDAIGSDMTGKGYVGLGYDGSAYKTDFYQYYPTTDTWTQLADFPGTPRINGTCFGIFPQFYVTTGDDGFNYLNDTWEYNYFGNMWTQKADFPGDPRAGASAFIIESRPFVGLGYGNGTFYDDFYEYTVLLSEESITVSQIDVYPNPTSDFLKITNLNQNHSVILYNELGQEVYNLASGEEKNNIDVSQFETGTYFVGIFEHNELLETKKIIVAP